ncbi:UBAP1-MVB12-associated (UMA)-domain containing protein 1 isoform X2 [Latimeria chalumnae]|uniref:UBAP1-MVB12-associated (UMA) domain containing 1 n=1 Tax=Latimeria chalumnae TaxID=7897 RepID=H3ALC2_LATCH|nr:PREDICTED: UBAP1-MVB12-associated (UMA)-domain containing protein 1 [Latimeria chalumnae]|eukprot:XP_014345970.1 PREDICTED: UBAP1-MVB12-associated (UMA)-domain containing protein 1 [Latimeria chalumnae]
MLSFFGIRKSQELKKGSTPDREADGFVVLGETNNERREKMQSTAPVQVQPTYTPPLQTNTGSPSTSAACGLQSGQQRNHTLEAVPLMSELLSDVPFTLAPHVLAIQSSVSDFSSILLLHDDDNLARFCYDFTLENSVLCNS